MAILGFIAIGLVAGLLARAVMPGREPAGLVVTMMLGVAGALVAGLLGRSLGVAADGGGPGVQTASIGALLVLGLYRVAINR